MNDLAGRACDVTPVSLADPTFDPKAWLAAYKEAGGSWFFIDDLVRLGIPVDDREEVDTMRKALTEEQLAEVRAEVMASYSQWEG